MCGGDGTYDPQAVRRQIIHSSSDGLSQLCARLLPLVSLDHIQELTEKQVDPQLLHPHWLLCEGWKQAQESALNL